MIGAESTVSFRCTNHGGKGRFRCLPEDEWPNPMLDKFQDDSISLEPFTFSPVEFALDNGETVDLTVVFKPKDESEVSKNCDGLR